MKELLNILIADKHKVIREGVRSLLMQAQMIQSFREAETGQQALSIIENHPIDLVIMEVNMKLLDGRCATKYIASKYHTVKIVIHSDYDNHDLIAKYILEGANGYVIKNEGNLPEAISIIMQDRHYFSEHLKPAVIKLQRKDYGSFRPVTFTTIETCILNLSAQGKSSEEIAKSMGNKKSTIEFHRKRMIKKFKVHNFVELVDYAHRIGKL